MDTLAILNFFLGKNISYDVALLLTKAVISTVIATALLFRGLIQIASNKKTTWYWNPLTKRFTLKIVDIILAKICGRGVTDCRTSYDNLSEEAKEKIKDRLKKKHPFLNIEVK